MTSRSPVWEEVERTVGGLKLGLGLLSVITLLVAASSAHAGDCSALRMFEIKHSQVLAGTLEDPAGQVLSGIELQLLSRKSAVRHVTTNNNGQYDFGNLRPGRYTIRLKGVGSAFCAPKVECGSERCSIERLTVNPKSLVKVE